MAMSASMGSVGTSVSIRHWPDVMLRRSGARPLRFRGHLLLEAASDPSESGVGHRLQLFETDDGGFVIATEVRHRGCDVVSATAVHVPDVERVAEALEAFDPRERICLDPSLILLDGQADVTGLEAALAGSLEQAVADYRQVVLSIIDERGGHPVRAAARKDQGG